MNTLVADMKRDRDGVNKTADVTQTPGKAYYTKDLVIRGPLSELWFRNLQK